MPWMAIASDSAVSLTMTAGTLASPGVTDISMSGLTVTAADQTSIGNLNDATEIDTRGSLVGWTVSATMTHIRKTFGMQDANGTAFSDGDVATAGSSDCTIAPAGGNGAASHTITFTDNAGAYTLRLASGSPGTAGTISSTPSAIGDGITISKPSTTFPSSGDVVRIPISCAFYTANTATPAQLQAVNTSSTYGLSLGSAAAFSGSGATSGANTVLTADEGTGNGSYTYDDGLSQTVLKNSGAGAHSGTLTITVA